ncbi:type IV secretion protein DotD [Marinobacter lutaoensis]|uniref:Type IV secretion protein DotD n=1 Tax=Marinobacter lutaoensis TaxID=135739 RepID=A0A1V2DPC8_9GAMM|nr:DotD/TraH family lipoprotein [Marinobacter lutaoensis]ONF42494.1 type IV secretion protein DotD [Marinobacter lutaoensis]
MAFKKTFASLLVPVFLAGCAASPQDVTLQVDPAVVQLSKAADEIAESYRMLSYAESARVSSTGIGETLDYQASDFPEQWRREVVLKEDYYGELESFLRGLSKLVGYQEPQIIGKSPIVPITIAINRSRKPLAEFLIDASYQAGGRALVTLDPDIDRLQITYPER